MLRPSKARLWKAIQPLQVRHRGYEAVQHLCHGVLRLVEQVHLCQGEHCARCVAHCCAETGGIHVCESIHR